MLAQELYNRVTPLLNHDTDMTHAIDSVIKEYIPESVGSFSLDSCPTPLEFDDLTFESGWFIAFPEGSAVVFVQDTSKSAFTVSVLGVEEPSLIPNFFYALAGHSEAFKESIFGPSFMEA